jgi:hypothetical protein
MKNLILATFILFSLVSLAGSKERNASKKAIEGINEERGWFSDDCGHNVKVQFEQKDLKNFTGKKRPHDRVIFLAGESCRRVIRDLRNYICSDKEALKGLKKISQVNCIPNKEAMTIERLPYKISIKESSMTVLYDPINPSSSFASSKNKELVKDLF